MLKVTALKIHNHVNARFKTIQTRNSPKGCSQARATPGTQERCKKKKLHEEHSFNQSNVGLLQIKPKWQTQYKNLPTL